MMVDRESAVPAYLQVAGILRARIQSGQYAPGQRVPSINDLTSEYGIARTTAGKALRVLINEGLAYVSPGMGVYVRRPRPER